MQTPLETCTRSCFKPEILLEKKIFKAKDTRLIDIDVVVVINCVRSVRDHTSQPILDFDLCNNSPSNIHLDIDWNATHFFNS